MGLGDELSKYIPKDFGKKKKKKQTDTATDAAAGAPTKKHVEEKNNDVVRKPEPEKSTLPAATATSRGDSAEDENEFPVKQHIVLRGHKKAVSTLAWDNTGDLLVSGEHGPRLQFWNFGGMSGSYESFRTVEPYEGQQIHAAKFNRTGDLLLCATGDPRAKLLARDGRTVREFKRGDMYVIDMRRTKGHVAALTSVDWSPVHSDVFITASADATVRVWNCERPMCQDHIIVAKTKTRGMRVAVTACAYSGDGSMIASAQQDGAISVWAAKGPFLRPSSHMDDAHAQGTETSCVAFAPNGRHLASRGGDDTVKLWDIRSLRTPLATAHALPSAGREANLIFSPTGRHILTGVAHDASQSPASPNGMVAALDSGDLTVSRHIGVPLSGNVMGVQWHQQIDQLAVASTSGDIAVLYSPETSVRGATLCAGKSRRPTSVLPAAEPVGPIITPHALPLFREDNMPISSKRRREKARDDPVLSKKPRMPLHGHGRGGAIGVNETQHIMKSIIKDTMRDEDPREALLKFAEAAESDPKFIAPAYKKSQDKPVFDYDSTDDPPSMRRRK
ncbi:hypothetical protein IW140_003048 [Coemansia sp. RSA 1813]|nr:hypothetical protein EV178_004207 [Coemansia sp. RSA 1646]KAJ1771311.1 hypothetical protein LPJ74_002462 [Coemansia sp. RSA 1843]KAJ2088965.1 hypothetical protein IW138_003806 [Coemansia sp. RSA 986]KAJ2213228.1 hypothetical protein EV179_004015 [Coemansia sp. RSA 487]KAJ2569494.1 hypothetical protein IW140_003048 [Coemansia sp. RSA 1813]